MNSGNSKTSDPHKLLLNLSDKVNLKRKDNIRLYQILASTMHGKKLKSHTKNNRFNISAPTRNEKFWIT